MSVIQASANCHWLGPHLLTYSGANANDVVFRPQQGQMLVANGPQGRFFSMCQTSRRQGENHPPTMTTRTRLLGRQLRSRSLSTATEAHESLLRFDMITGTWVVYSSGRSNRPHQTDATPTKIRLDELPRIVKDCPFCAGNESMTPPAKMSIDGLRVVNNKYPAVAPLKLGEKHEHKMPNLINDGILTNNQVPAVGFHEVVIESPFHNEHIATSADTIMARDLLRAFRDRGLEHRAYADIEHTVFFKNHGTTAGASLVHPHSQIVSTPVVPVEAERLQSLAWKYFKTHRWSLYERIVAEEMALHESQQGHSRIVDVTENFVAMVPFASPGPYVINIIPRFQASGLEEQGGLDSSDFTTLSDDLLDECASVLQRSLRRLHILLEPDFNLVVQTAPVPNRGVQAAVQSSTFFRWHIRITPRLGAGAMAGFELGSGFFSNAHMPEEDAERLRDVCLQ